MQASLKDPKIKKNIPRNIKCILRAWNSGPHLGLRGKSPFYVMYEKEDDYLRNKYDTPNHYENDGYEEFRLLSEFTS